MGAYVRKATVGAVVAVMMALAAAGVAQAAWSGVDPVVTGRYNHTATLLQDGRVLVTGGNDNAPVAGARLYDPATGTWSNAAAMHVGRSGQAAALLRDGRVLVAGGVAPADVPSGSEYTATAEIYDPATDSWASAGSMSTVRFEPTMTVLDDGRVLVAGGFDVGA